MNNGSKQPDIQWFLTDGQAAHCRFPFFFLDLPQLDQLVLG
jgi:hypothetical protein